MAYCRGIDRRDPDLIRSIFWEDAIADHGEAWYRTGNQWVDHIFADYLSQYEVTAHYVLNEWYKVEGDQAQGETHRISYHRRPNGEEVTAAARLLSRRHPGLDEGKPGSSTRPSTPAAHHPAPQSAWSG
jgi:hypothetical protein